MSNEIIDSNEEKTIQDSKINADLKAIMAEQNKPDMEKVQNFIKKWSESHDGKLDMETSEHGYPVIDLLQDSSETSMDFLTALDTAIHPVYHGMHNNEYRREAGMPDVAAWDGLDPALGHQPPDRRVVYATTNLRGALVHATLENMKVDANPHSGEIFSLRPMPGLDGTSSFIEVSPHLDEALRSGEERFTDGLLYILPADNFTPNPNSNHELISQEKVAPLLVVKVGKEVGRGIVMPENARWVRET